MYFKSSTLFLPIRQIANAGPREREFLIYKRDFIFRATLFCLGIDVRMDEPVHDPEALPVLDDETIALLMQQNNINSGSSGAGFYGGGSVANDICGDSGFGGYSGYSAYGGGFERSTYNRPIDGKTVEFLIETLNILIVSLQFPEEWVMVMPNENDNNVNNDAGNIDNNGDGNNDEVSSVEKGENEKKDVESIEKGDDDKEESSTNEIEKGSGSEEHEEHEGEKEEEKEKEVKVAKERNAIELFEGGGATDDGDVASGMRGSGIVAGHNVSQSQSISTSTFEPMVHTERNVGIIKKLLRTLLSENDLWIDCASSISVHMCVSSSESFVFFINLFCEEFVSVQRKYVRNYIKLFVDLLSVIDGKEEWRRREFTNALVPLLKSPNTRKNDLVRMMDGYTLIYNFTGHALHQSFMAHKSEIVSALAKRDLVIRFD